MSKLKQLFETVANAVMPAKQPTNADLMDDTLAQPTDPLTGQPMLTGVRRAIDDTVSGGWTPSRLALLLANARTLQNTSDYFSLAEEIEERDLNYRSVIGTRKLAVSALPFAYEPASDKLRDRKVLEFVQGVMESQVVRGSLYSFADAISKGIALGRIDWNYGAQWTPANIEIIDQRWVVFDRKDGKTVMLAPSVPGGAPEALKPYRFIQHTPQLKAGLPVRSGLAAAAAWLYVARGLAMRDWLGFIELYGQPVRIGKYKAGTKGEDIRVLKQAVASIGTDSAAVMPESMMIEFIKDATVSGTADAYEKLCRYCDEVVARLVLGGSLTSGQGSGSGSFALGQVHNEVRADLLKADAAALSATLMRDLVAPLVALNFGADVPLPKVYLQVEEAEDISALVQAVEKLVPLGLEVSQDELRARLRLRAPKAGEAVLAAPAAPAAPAPAAPVANTLTHGCPVHSHAADYQRDAFDDLSDNMFGQWERVSATANAALTDAVANATNIDEMRAALVDAVKTADISDIVKMLTAARAKARVAGEGGADV